jgi:ElaB/YqjD/DUF883 family membrane-anchored ribosome-binding protein
LYHGKHLCYKKNPGPRKTCCSGDLRPARRVLCSFVRRSLLRRGTLLANKTKPEAADIFKIGRNPFCGPGAAESGYKHAVFLREEHIMDAETRAIRQEIDATREAMTDKVEQLESRVQQRTDEVKEALDIRQVTSERPWTMVGIATGAGFMIGTFGAELLSLLRPMTGMAFLIGYAWGRFGQPGQ